MNSRPLAPEASVSTNSTNQASTYSIINKKDNNANKLRRASSIKKGVFEKNLDTTKKRTPAAGRPQTSFNFSKCFISPHIIAIGVPISTNCGEYEYIKILSY